MPHMTKIKDISLISDEDLEVFLEDHPEIYSAEAFRDYVMYHGKDYIEYALANFEEAYQGQWEDMQAFAWNYYDDVVDGPKALNGFRVEVDIVAWECDYWISENGHVFNRNV